MKSLKEIRVERGVKQKAVADYLGITRQTYSRYENNTEDVPISVVKSACEFIGYPVDEIFLGDEVSKTNED